MGFFVSILLVIWECIEVIMGDSVEEEEALRSKSEYLIVIFDQMGHLSMLTVFVVRLKMCFINSVFGYTKNLMRLLYCCLILLSFGSFVVIMEIVNDTKIETIIISEIIWELMTEAMTLWLLYLFVSKLQSLIKNSLGSCRKNLRMTISYNVSQKELSRSTKKENSIRRQSKFSQTSNNNDKNDKNNDKNKRVRSPSPSPSPSPRPSRPNQTVLNNQNLINVMTKMTLLVIVAVIGSMASMIGNIYVEIISFNTIKRRTPWTYLLPVIDMVMSSFMLYLQFDFTKNIYSKICGKVDIYFIEFCGDVLDKNINKKQTEKIEVPSTTKTTTKLRESGNANKLTLDISTIEAVPRPSSPSPSPKVQKAIKNNEAIQVKPANAPNPPPPRPPRFSYAASSNLDINANAPPITPRSTRSPRSPSSISTGFEQRNSTKINVSFWENKINKK